jgi:hypothetical protein
MNRILSKLVPIRGGEGLSRWTVQRLQDIQDAIHALARGENLAPSQTIQRTPGDGMMSLDHRPPGAPRAAAKPAFWTALGPVPDSEPVEWQVTPTLGYLTYQNAGAEESEHGVTGYLVPKINGVSMEDPEVRPLELPGPVAYIYLRVQTDADGVPDFGIEGGPVTLEAFEEPKKSVHHVRPSPSGGEEKGDYYFLLLETEGNGGDPVAPVVKRRITGNRELPNQLIEIANIGGERELYSGYLKEEDKHEFRSLKQLTDGEQFQIPLLKPLEDGEEEEDFIPWLGLGVEKLDSPAPPVDFELGPDKKTGLLTFKGVDGTATFVGGSVTFAKGIATAFSSLPEEGGNLNLSLYAIDYDEAGSIFGSEYLVIVLYWRNGAYLGTVDPEDDAVPLDEISIRMVGV